jgi:arabinofuranan 3-O-arabinosyltransferase
MTRPLVEVDDRPTDRPLPRRPDRAAPGPATEHRRSVLVHAGLAVLVTVPLLLTKPGQVGADTKQYLYLDPARLLSRAWAMWDPNTGLGTVTHQNIGYLFPMGPYYWAIERLGAPDWVAQRLWLAGILFAAAAGVLFLARTMGWRGAGPVVAALAYALSPYTLDYAARISAILLPFAALPWLIGIAMRALRTGGWRWPAVFALVTLVVGGVNATALLLAGIGPVLWFPFAVWVEREATLREALGTVARIGVLTVGVSMWWMAALSVQGGYGLPVLDFSETLDAVAVTSVSIEVVRGLGYWFFYGSDKLGPWISASVAYTQRLVVLAVTYALPILAVAGAFVTRFRHRAYFVALVLVGTVVAVGAHPFTDPSPLGGVFKAFAETSTAGLALRSTARAVPLVVLGFAVLLGTAVTAVGRRLKVAGAVSAGLVVALVVAANPPLLTGQFVDENLMRDEDVPAYWEEAAAWLDARGDGTRVLEVPGIDFAAYRWGNTVDPVTPGLMDRPYVARELIAFLGSPAAADLLIALDRRFQEGIAEPEALAPVARLLGAGDVLLRSDLQFERYRTPRPRILWDELTPAPPGLGDPVPFGDPVPNVPDPRLPLVDELALATPPGAEHPPPVADFPVEDPTPIVRAHPAAGPLVLAGDGEGVVDAAAEGLLDADRVLLYAAAMSDADVTRALADGADLVVTDTNRRRARRWRTVRENAGYTERAGEEPADDLADARLDVFPDADDDDRTVAVTPGAEVSATSYGNPVSLTADNRPTLAVDGDVETAWETGAFSAVGGERLTIVPDEPVTTDHVTLLQPVRGARNRHLTEVRLHFDGDGDGDPVDVVLGPESLAEPGQVVGFPSRTFARLEIELVATDRGDLPDFAGVSGVGFAEVGIPGVALSELIRLPVDLLGTAGAASQDHRVTLLMTRQRSNPGEPVRFDEEPALARAFALPTDRSFTLAGAARLSAYAPDDVLDELLGAGGGLVARSSGRLPGDLGARSAAAFDGDPSTHWSPGFLGQEGHWIEVTTPEPVTFDHLDLELVADGRHSVPTRLVVEAGGESRTVDVPAVADQPEDDAVVAAPVSFPALTGSTVRVTLDAVRDVTTTDYYTTDPITMPVGVAELGLAGASEPLPTGPVSATCHEDLLTVDGSPVGVRLAGDAGQAAARGRLAVEACAGGPVALDAGNHVLRAAKGRDTGVDLDRLVLASAAGGGPVTLAADGRVPAAGASASAPSPTVEVLDAGRTSVKVRVTGATAPTWLVLGQSQNAGWTASVDGGGSLGGSELVDGFANGWLLPGTADGSPVEVTMTWQPQRTVWFGLGASLVAVLACIALAVLDPRRLGGRRAAPALDRDLDPALATPLDGAGRPPSRAVRVGGALAAAVVAGVVADPLLAVPVGLVALVALARPRGRALLALGAVGCLGLAASYVLVQQFRWEYTSDFAWPAHFDRVHLLAWAGVLLLATDALVERLRDPPPAGSP